MAFTYDFENNPLVAYVRLLIADTVEPAIFTDAEITAAYTIQQSTFQSGMFYSASQGQILPATPVSYLRVAALLLDSLASARSRLVSAVTKLLDVTIDAGAISRTASSLRDQAARFREIDDDAGAFVIIEQCRTCFSFEDRYWRQVQRQIGG
jgi:hypothetical protein